MTDEQKRLHDEKYKKWNENMDFSIGNDSYGIPICCRNCCECMEAHYGQKRRADESCREKFEPSPRCYQARIRELENKIKTLQASLEDEKVKG